MNCANHPDRERVAFCQNCGKPLCNDCVRTVGSSTFCEPCLIARVAGTPGPGFGYPAGVPPFVPPTEPGEPNPTIAAALGFIPGVGAMYNGQYAKGIVHLIVFALLVSLANGVDSIFGLFIAGWEFYMVIEAHHTARARRDGTPLPNPFGLNDVGERLGFGSAWPGTQAGAARPDATQSAPPPNATPPNATPPPYSYPYTPHYSAYVPPASQWGAPMDASAPGVPPPYPDPGMMGQHRIPPGAIWLIGLGIFFLIGNTRYLQVLHGRFLTPLLLIGLGVWVFFRKMTETGQGIENDGTPLYRWRLNRAISKSMWLVLVGVIFLLHTAGYLSFSRAWPIYMIAAGVAMFLKRGAYPGPYYGYPPPPVAPAPPVAAAPGTAIVPASSHASEQPLGEHDNEQEGR
jgi:hypothetical protein